MVLAGQESFRVKRRAVDKRKKANEVIKLIFNLHRPQERRSGWKNSKS